MYKKCLSFRDSASLWSKGDYKSFLAISHDPSLKSYTNPPKGRFQDLRGKKFSTTSPVRPVVLKLVCRVESSPGELQKLLVPGPTLDIVI